MPRLTVDGIADDMLKVSELDGEAFYAAMKALDARAVADFLPGFEASFWIGIGAPKNTPAEIVDKLNKEINAGLANPGKTRLADLGGTALPGSPAEFGKLIAD